MSTRSATLALLLIAVLAIAPASSLSAAVSIEIVNLDAAGEGLNSSTPWTGRGGNSATTLGEARRVAIEFAAQVWSEQLDSRVPIRIGVSFDPLGGGSVTILGKGGPESVFRDFTGAPLPSTWYPSALADRLAGIDLAPGDLDLLMQFNSDVDGPEVFGNDGFDYGLTPSSPADSWFVHVALHEMAHGLGFLTGVSVVTGAKFLSYDDAYMVHLVREGGVPEAFPEMTDGQRLAALSSAPWLRWAGDGVAAASAFLSGGASPEGRVEMYAPTTGGSAGAMNHFSTEVAPDQIEEPFYFDVSPDFRLTRAVLLDIGWGAAPECTAIALE